MVDLLLTADSYDELVKQVNDNDKLNEYEKKYFIKIATFNKSYKDLLNEIVKNDLLPEHTGMMLVFNLFESINRLKDHNDQALHFNPKIREIFDKSLKRIHQKEQLKENE